MRIWVNVNVSENDPNTGPERAEGPADSTSAVDPVRSSDESDAADVEKRPINWEFEEVETDHRCPEGNSVPSTLDYFYVNLPS